MSDQFSQKQKNIAGFSPSPWSLRSLHLRLQDWHHLMAAAKLGDVGEDQLKRLGMLIIW
jgi:hypothetical protein